jgi:hypothetical protein
MHLHENLNVQQRLPLLPDVGLVLEAREFRQLPSKDRNEFSRQFQLDQNNRRASNQTSDPGH